MSNTISHLDEFEKDLNGWKNFDPNRGYGFTNDGAIKIIQDPPPKLRNDLLHKLYWPLFGPLDGIKVWELLNVNEYTLVPFQDHPMTSELLVRAPCNQFQIAIEPVEERITHIESNCNHDEDRWKGPETLVLDNSAESPITLGRFVTAVHQLFNNVENKPMILECINMFYSGPPVHHGGYLYSVDVEADGTWPPRNKIPEGAVSFFEEAEDYEVDEGDWVITVRVFTEGDFGTSSGQFWERKKQSQQEYELEKQYYAV